MAETTETKWILINKDEALNPGDRIRMYYTIIGPTYMVAAQVVAIESKIESDPRFRLMSTSLPQGDGWVKDIWFEILIKYPPASEKPTVLTASIVHAVIAAAFAIISIFIWLSFNEVRKMEIGPDAVQKVIKETGWTAVKIGATAIIAMFALKWWRQP